MYAYDAYNRLTTITLSPSTVLRTYYYDYSPPGATFSQNALGRLTAVQYPPLAQRIQRRAATHL
jgi:hypothetical protein